MYEWIDLGESVLVLLIPWLSAAKLGLISKIIEINTWGVHEMTYILYTAFWNTSWWRHQMETFSALLALFAGNSPVTGEFPAQRSVTRSFDVLFDLRLNKRLSKQSWGCDLRRHRAHYDVMVMIFDENYRVLFKCHWSDKMSQMVWIMAWCRIAYTPLPEAKGDPDQWRQRIAR